MKQWMLSHEGKFISFNYEYGFWVSSEIEIIEREVYVASDYIRVNEDCRILSGTFHSMKERYGINLDAFISGDFLNCYLPEAIDHVEKMLNNINSISIAEEAEKKLEFILKQEDDKDFDERMLRVKKIIDVFKQGAIFVTRV
jgi:nitrate reductase NapAB chaperone NapD